MTKYELVNEYAPKHYDEQRVKKAIEHSYKADLERIYDYWSKSKQEQADRQFCWALAIR